MTTDTSRMRPARVKRAVVVEREGRPKMVVYVFGRYVRAAHWIRNAALIWLILSGIYIANPFLARAFSSDTANNFILAQVRGWHVAAGWILLAFTIGRIYQFLFINREGKLGLGAELRMAPILFDWKAWRDQLKFYLLMSREHPHLTYSNYGPLQYLVYTALYAALLIISVTGILLAAPYVQGGIADFGANLLRPIEVAVGGLANIRMLHHVTMWFFILFTVVHIYMAVWNSLRAGNLLVEGIISGFAVRDIPGTREATVEDVQRPTATKAAAPQADANASVEKEG